MAFSCPQDKSDFVEKVRSDLAIFVKSSPFDRVLVFPPVNSFHRFLIHQLVQDSFDQLRTFSIGEDPDRRIVVCTKDLVARVDASKDESQARVSTESAPSNLMMVFGDADKGNITKLRKSRSTLPTIGIYRPPAARRSSEESPKLLVSSTPEPTVVEANAKNAVKPTRPRLRRPDQQVYVPRAKRAFQDSEKFEDASASAVDNYSTLQLYDSYTNDSESGDKIRLNSNQVIEEKPSKHPAEEKFPNLIVEDRKSSKHRSFSPTGEFRRSPPPAEDDFSHLIIEDRNSSKHRSFSPTGEFRRSPPPVEDKFTSNSNVIIEDRKASRHRSCSPTAQFHRSPPPADDKFTSNSNLIIEDRKASKHRSFSPTGAFHSLPPRASQLVETKKKLCQSTSSDLDLGGIPVEGDRSSTMNAAQPITLPSRAEVLVEKKKKLCQSNSLTENYKWGTKQESDQEAHRLSADTAEPPVLTDEDSRITCSKRVNSTVSSESGILSVIEFKVTSSEAVSETKKKCDIVQLEDSSKVKESYNSGMTSWTTNDADQTKNDKNALVKLGNQSAESSDDDYQDAKSNGLHTVSGGSSESLSSSDSVNASVFPVQLMKPVKTEPKKKTSPNKPTRVFNPDECDWDALLDEDGDVLDPFLMKELTSAVGEVQVTQPKSDYRNYRSQLPADHHRSRRSTTDEDFSHVVEIFSFPPEFKTNDLVAVLSPFKNTAGGFEIKWVDDTHALGVFASAIVADQVLAYQHPMVRMRPLCDATLESRLKARRLSESIQSFRPRPETCAALARRLVTGALGVKLPTARQEREEEKRVLKEAREKRRLAVQQQDDIWNS